MAKDKDSQLDLVRLLREVADLYSTISLAIDTTKPDMPIIYNQPKELLESYLVLYGQQDNRHGGFNTAKSYESFMKRAKKFSKLPEVDGLVKRIEKARQNMEQAINALDSKTVLKLGYELRKYYNKLLVYNKE